MDQDLIDRINRDKTTRGEDRSLLRSSLPYLAASAVLATAFFLHSYRNQSQFEYQANKIAQVETQYNNGINSAKRDLKSTNQNLRKSQEYLIDTQGDQNQSLTKLLEKEQVVGLADWDGDCIYDEIVLRENEKYGKNDSDFGVFYVKYDDGRVEKIGRGNDLVSKLLNECRDFGEFDNGGKGVRDIYNRALQVGSVKSPYDNADQFNKEYSKRTQREIKY